MCPISGLVQFLIVIVTLLLICHSVVVRSLKVKFEPVNATIFMYDSAIVNYTITDDENENYKELKIYSDDPKVASVENIILTTNPGLPFKDAFSISANFLGKTSIHCKIVETNTTIEDQFKVVVIRKPRIIDKLFTASVITLVSIIYINFGCALNWSNVIQTMKRPIGPTIGFIGQFLVMPLLSFGVGKLLFPDNPAMQLGMFFTGVSPAGGASNIWTVVLNGNVDLSVTMTTISTLAAFGMIPFWLFTLGHIIFKEADLKVPYFQIATYAIGLIIPLAIGFLISRYLKRVGQFLVRIMKGFAGILLLFIIVFAIVTNLYLFEMMSWRIILAGMGLPYFGFLIGYVMAKLLKQPDLDCLAIAIETGVQNTGIAIFLLKFILPQPLADLTTDITIQKTSILRMHTKNIAREIEYRARRKNETQATRGRDFDMYLTFDVAPVSVAMMTPFPLMLLFIIKKIVERISSPTKQLNGNPIYTVDSNANQADHRLIAVVQ